MAFTGICGSFIGVCSTTRFGLFVSLGCFPSPPLVWSDRPPRGVCITGGLGDLCQPATSPPAQSIGASLLIPAPRAGALHRSSFMASWTARFHPSWFGQGVFATFFVILLLEELLGLPHVLSELGRIYIPAIGIPATVLSNSRPSSLRQAAGAGPVIDQCWSRRRDKVLVLAMMIHHPSYLMLLNFV